MGSKKDDYEEDDGDESPQSRLFLDKFTIFVLIAFIIIGELFFHFLSIRTGATYGIVQMIFAFMAAIVITLFLVWIRFIMVNNRFMGGFIAIAGIIASAYALTRRYQGAYTTTFLLLGIAIALSYVIYYFVKFSKK